MFCRAYHVSQVTVHWIIPTPLDFGDILSFEIYIKLLKFPSHIGWKIQHWYPNSYAHGLLGWDEMTLMRAVVLVMCIYNSL